MYNLTQPIVVGVIVFALSQYFLKLILEPIIQFRKLLSEISHTLLYHQQELLSNNAEDLKLYKEIAGLSAKLRSSVYMIPFYNFLVKLRIFGLPKRDNILLSCRKLNILSYPLLEGVEELREKSQKNEKILKDLSKLLPIETTFMINEESNP
ncbi:MAG: hypothetical protein JRJ38_16005 [Deltaproteobacteria bacterium]|nr:hypothetical protein [Deltaproteobacteria bacterium]